MKLTSLVLRFTNNIRFNHIPGNILIGKHRIWPKLTPKAKRYLLNRIDNEIDNMKHISRAYMTREEESVISKLNEINEEKKEKEKLEKIRANKNKMKDVFMNEHLKPVRDTATWE